MSNVLRLLFSVYCLLLSSIIHHPSTHHPSSIIIHPSSIIHHQSSSSFILFHQSVYYSTYTYSYRHVCSCLFVRYQYVSQSDSGETGWPEDHGFALQAKAMVKFNLSWRRGKSLVNLSARYSKCHLHCMHNTA